MPFVVDTGGPQQLADGITPSDPPDLIDDLPPFEQGSYDIQAVLRAVGGELGRVETARQQMVANFFPTTAVGLLHFFEQLFGLPPDSTLLTLAQRRALVLAYFKALASSGSGLDWIAAITTAVGSNWTYREHDPNDGTSPAAYVLEILLPFSQPVAVPSSLVATPQSGGSLAPSTTFYYAVTATTAFGETLACAPVSASTTAVANKEIQLAWAAEPPPTSGYNVYRGLSSSQLFFLANTPTNSYLDDGAAVVTSQQEPNADTSGSLLTNFATVLIRQITPAHLQLEYGYDQGFLVEISQIGINPL